MVAAVNKETERGEKRDMDFWGRTHKAAQLLGAGDEGWWGIKGTTRAVSSLNNEAFEGWARAE